MSPQILIENRIYSLSESCKPVIQFKEIDNQRLCPTTSEVSSYEWFLEFLAAKNLEKYVLTYMPDMDDRWNRSDN